MASETTAKSIEERVVTYILVFWGAKMVDVDKIDHDGEIVQKPHLLIFLDSMFLSGL